MTPAQTKEHLEKIIGKGFRYAWVAKSTHSLNTAITFKQWSTSREGAQGAAEKVLMPNRSIKVWNLEKELLRLTKS